MKYTLGNVYLTSGTPTAIVAADMPNHKGILLSAGSATMTFVGKVIQAGTTLQAETSSNITILTPANTSQTLPIRFSSFSSISGTGGSLTLLN